MKNNGETDSLEIAKIRNEASVYSMAHDMLYFTSLNTSMWLNFVAIFFAGGGATSAAVAAIASQPIAAGIAAGLAAIGSGCSIFERVFGFGPSVQSHRQAAIAYTKIRFECERAMTTLKSGSDDANFERNEKSRLQGLLEEQQTAVVTDPIFVKRAREKLEQGVI